MIGTKLAHYEITSHLGTGGMGEVYQATDSKLGRSVAIKLLPEAFTHDADRAARFEREARVLASLNHPNIATIHGVEESGGRKFLVMELVPGETLAERIRRGPIPVEESLAVAAQITEALEAAHEKGVVHRDLKPANIKVNPDGRVKVLDFGLAKAFEPESANLSLSNSPTISMAATQQGVILGTAAYMSPEQARGLTADPRSDIFSLGCVLFEMLTGKQAFHGETVSDILASVLKSEPDLQLLPERLNPKISELLRRSLEKNPKRRWHAAGDVRIEIESVIADPRGVIIRETQAVPLTPFWKRALPVVMAVVTNAVILGAGIWYFKPQVSTPIVTRFPVTLGEGQQIISFTRHVVAISPDGTQMVYMANNRLYKRAMAELEARVIPGTDILGDIREPVFSPDSKSVVFWSSIDSTLKKIAVSGGAAVTICQADEPFGVSWGMDGILFGQGSKGILRVSAIGGKPELLIRVKTGELAHGPQMLPGGEAVLFTLGTGRSAEEWDKAQIVVQVLKSGERKTVIQGFDAHYVPTGHIVYGVNGTLYAVPFDLKHLEVSGGPAPIVEGVRRVNDGTTGSAQFSFSDTGSLIYVQGPVSTTGIQRVFLLQDRKGAFQQLKLGPGAYEFPRISPDGRRVAYGTQDGKEAAIWIYDLSETSAARRLTIGGGNRYPVWSADSQRVAFQSDREGDLGIFWQKADGSGTAERLTKAAQGDAHFPDSWSPDGQRFSFTSVKGGTASVWVYSLQDMKASLFAEAPDSFLGWSMFSHDGRWIAYVSNETKIGNYEIWVQPFPVTGAKQQISKGGAIHPLWSPSGKELFFVPRGGLMTVSITTKPSLSFGTPSPVTVPFRNMRPNFPRNFDITPDEKLIGVVLADQGQGVTPTTPQIRVVLNWFEDLKQRMSVR